jgi:hypothetical protein
MATGLIQDKMAQPDGEELTQENVSKNIKMPPELQKAYDKVVIAGMKMLFSKETHRIMLKELQRGGPLADRLGKGIAGLMLILYKESNATMPPAVIIPAGIELLMQAVDFLRKTGLEKVTNKDIGDGMEQMITIIAQKFGASPDKLQAALSQFDNQNVDAAAQQMGA